MGRRVLLLLPTMVVGSIDSLRLLKTAPEEVEEVGASLKLHAVLFLVIKDWGHVHKLVKLSSTNERERTRLSR